MTFLEPGGRASVIEPTAAVPAPLHTAPAFLRAACLSLPDKLSIAAGLAALTPITPHDTGESFLQWLRRHGQTERAIDRFWKTVLVSALNEEIDLISVPYAAQVMRESFLKSRAAGRMGVPTRSPHRALQPGRRLHHRAWRRGPIPRQCGIVPGRVCRREAASARQAKRASIS